MARTTPTPKLPKQNPWNDQSEDDAGKPKQVIVPAGKAAPKVQTTAANSVFAAGTPAVKPKRTRGAADALDPTAIQIESGVPIPPNRRGADSSPYQALLDKMQPGDCVRLTRRQVFSLASFARDRKVKMSLRKLGDVRALAAGL